MPHTTLVALSISPVFGYADKFKGMLFMDSFDPGALKNPYRLRENGLSTLMACMGFAECLQEIQELVNFKKRQVVSQYAVPLQKFQDDRP